MKILFLVSLLFLMLPKASWAKEILETGTSVSHVYDARTVFTNPAGLAYQRELNGSHFSSSLSWALKDSANDLAVGLGYGAWGLGIETFLSGTGNRQRYSLGSSLSLSPWFFLGTRLAFTSSGPNLDGITQIDLGLQVRPSPFFSFGLLANRLNQPFQNGAQLSQQYTLGLTIQPLKRLLIVADFETSSDSFGKAWNYQSSVQFELLQDLFLSAGYDKEAEAHFGIQWDFGRTSLSSFARPESSQKTAVAHAQFSTLPNPSAQSATTALKVKIDSDLSEEGESSSIFASGQESFSELLLKIDRTADNPQLRSIFVDLESFPLGMGAATELNAALSKARNRGKIIHVALGNANLKEYLIATSANSISIDASGSLQLTGPKSERYYLKGTLDKLGIEADMVKRGEYKSAPETFTMKRASESSRKNTFEILDQTEKEIAQIIQKHGRVSEAKWNQARKMALLSPKEALQINLVDRISDPAQVQEELSEALNLREMGESKSRRLSLPPKVAVIVAKGDIVKEKIKILGLFGSDQITPEKMGKLLSRVQNDPLVKGVVMRVSSGGGDVLASNQIANQIKKLASIKPVVISMGDVAASGGYFISAPGKKIFASPLTLTGSIGVFAGKPSLESLYKKWDLSKEILSRSPYPGIYSESQKWSPEERDIIAKQVNHYYDTFIDYVSEHRKLNREKVEFVAQGRVWLGRKAKEGKLVDEVGSILDAIEEVKSSAGLDEFKFEVVRTTPKLLESLSQLAYFRTDIPNWLQMSASEENPFWYWCPESLN